MSSQVNQDDIRQYKPQNNNSIINSVTNEYKIIKNGNKVFCDNNLKEKTVTWLK